MFSRIKNRQKLIKAFENLVILFDDVTKIGYFMGLGNRVHADQVNFMTKHGKGLVYVCITEDRAQQLTLPAMTHQNLTDGNKIFSVSVDLKTSTTGISAFERADTIHAFVNQDTQPEDFLKPGHIFPLISVNNGLLGRYGIAEGAISLTKMMETDPVAYLCEILDEKGDIATFNQLQSIAKAYQMEFITLSEILELQYQMTEWLEVTQKQQIQVKNRMLNVYTIANQLNHDQYQIYLKPGQNGLNRVKLYDECPLGDLFGERHNCQCSKHFKQFFEDFLEDKLDCIVYRRTNDSKPLSSLEQQAVSHQLKELIYQLGSHVTPFTTEKSITA
jgi:3,4-dihydroxy 2-butanone 4-phosphate synthase / GTP cyclohydrolase II